MISRRTLLGSAGAAGLAGAGLWAHAPEGQAATSDYKALGVCSSVVATMATTR